MKKQNPFNSKLQELVSDEIEVDDFFNQVDDEALADPYPINSKEDKKNKKKTKEVHPAPSPSKKIDLREEEWFKDDEDSYDGQLAVDVYQDKKNIYVKAAIAGVKPTDIDIHLNNDMVTIKGKREQCHEDTQEDDYYIKECYWGGFSRSIILPVDVKTDQVKANIEHGLLTITLPKSKRPRNTKIEVKEVKK